MSLSVFRRQEGLPHEQPIAAKDLREILLSQSLDGVLIYDETYYPISRNLLTSRIFSETWRFRMGLPMYSDRFNCNNFSSAFCVAAAKWYAENSCKDDPQAPAIGEIGFDPEKGDAHSINFCITPEFKALFIEPQKDEIIEVKQADLRRSLAGRMA